MADPNMSVQYMSVYTPPKPEANYSQTPIDYVPPKPKRDLGTVADVRKELMTSIKGKGLKKAKCGDRDHEGVCYYDKKGESQAGIVTNTAVGSYNKGEIQIFGNNFNCYASKSGQILSCERFDSQGQNFIENQNGKYTFKTCVKNNDEYRHVWNDALFGHRYNYKWQSPITETCKVE